jgi:chromosome segregation ATPase
MGGWCQNLFETGKKFMKKICICSLFLGLFVMFGVAEDVALLETLKGFETQKIKIDSEVKIARENIDNLTATNKNVRKNFLDNKRSLQPNTFKFTDEENEKKLVALKAEITKLDEKRAEVIEQIKNLMNSDVEYKRKNDEANGQLEEIKEIRKALPKANMHYTQVLKNQREIDAKILKIKEQIELEKKESTGDNK